MAKKSVCKLPSSIFFKPNYLNYNFYYDRTQTEPFDHRDNPFRNLVPSPFTSLHSCATKSPLPAGAQFLSNLCSFLVSSPSNHWPFQASPNVTLETVLKAKEPLTGARLGEVKPKDQERLTRAWRKLPGLTQRSPRASTNPPEVPRSGCRPRTDWIRTDSTPALRSESP